jgi:hypothetical protein
LGRTAAEPLSTRDAVATLTPARSATSRRLVFLPWVLVDFMQEKQIPSTVPNGFVAEMNHHTTIIGIFTS